VRHGAVDNPLRLRYGRLPGFFLSRPGQLQADASGLHLASLGLRRPLLLTSPLERAAETAGILGGHLGLHPSTEPDLIEIGSRYDGLPRRLAPALYLARRLDPAHRGLDEPLALAAARVVAALFARRASHDGDLIAVSHQLPIRATVLALTRGLAALDGPLPAATLLRLRQPIDPGYAAVIALSPRPPGRWVIDAVFSPPG